MQNWTPARLADLTGQTHFITGGNSGVGFEAAKILCSKGATVIIGARSEAKATKALAAITAATPKAKASWVQLDLTDPESIATAAAQVIERHPKLDSLVNNAGVMQTPKRQTSEGFELQFATNHLGHFRLARALYGHLAKSNGRVVVVSSIVHHQGKIHLDDLMQLAAYNPTTSYSQSKLANIMFAFELDRRLKAANSPVASIPCHPGYSATNLQAAGVGMEGGSRFFRGLYRITNMVVAQSAVLGSYPLVLAAADPEAESGIYYGPTGMGDMRGPVGKSKVAKHARDEAIAGKLWEATEALVGDFPIPPAA
jgi:NAD(P)-dependent dehydrogenase (short-subunit alcohol dehydrogenase family)